MDFTNCEFIYNKLRQENRPIAIYGTGNGAEKLIYHLNNYKIPIAGIFVSDDFAREREFCGFKVQKFSDLKKEFGELTVLLGFATDRPELLLKIKELSERVEGRLFVPEVPVFGNDIFTPELLKSREKDLELLYQALADTQSRRVLEALVRFKLTANPQELYSVETPRQEVYENIIKPNAGSVFVDAGAYNGDTAEEFIKYCPNFGKIYAIEPAPVNFRKLSLNPDLQRDNVVLINCAVSNKAGEMGFSNKGGRSPYLAEGGKIAVRVNTIPALVKETPNILKLDVEGAEEQCLNGASELIKKHAPALMVSVYHKNEDFIDIPLKVLKMQPQYRLYLRHHPYLPAWETNLYAVKDNFLEVKP